MSDPEALDTSLVRGGAPRPSLLILNRKSRNGEAAAERVRAALSGAGIACQEEPCEGADKLPSMIRALAGTVDRVLVGGGDGTLNATLPACSTPACRSASCRSALPTTSPARSAFRSTRPLPPASSRQADANGSTSARPTATHFSTSPASGSGWTSPVPLTHDAKSRWGTLGYAVAGFRALQRMRSFTVEIEQEGTMQRARTVHLAVGNGRHYGGGMTVSEHAAIDDGRLNVYSLEVHSIWRLLMLLPSMRKGRHGRWQEVRTLSAADLTIRTRRPRSVNTDGEITTRTPARFRVRPGAVEVFVP